MAPLRFHLLVIKGGIIPPKYIKKVEEIQIRPARLSDAKKLAEINLLCWQKNYQGIIDDKFLNQMSMTEKRIERFKEQIKKSDFYFCALKHNQIVGYLSAQKIKNKKPAPYEILYFYIHPDFQHQGIGSKLFAYFKEKINFQPFYLYMLDGNQQGKKFYQKMGGKRFPQFDKDTEVLKLKMHDIYWIFNSKD